MNVSSERGLDHAATAGLTSFVLCDEANVIEYEAIPATVPRRYRPSGRSGTIAIAQNGNRRLNLPAKLRGHAITTWPDFVTSVYLNLDLIRRGYFNCTWSRRTRLRRIQHGLFSSATSRLARGA